MSDYIESAQQKLESMFLIEQLKYKALGELETRVEKHLKNEFYNKILPKMIKEVKESVTVDIVQGSDFLELKIKLKNINP